MTLVNSSLIFWLFGYALISRITPGKYNRIIPIIFTSIFLVTIAPVSFVILISTALLSGYLVKLRRIKSASLIAVISFLALIFSWFKIRLNFPSEPGFNDILIPLGLSYYIFRQIHYLFEAYKNKLPKHDLLDYLNYLFFLPTFIVGPIHRFQNFYKEYRRRRWDKEYLSLGLERILIGYSKIVILGNFLISVRLAGFINRNLTGNPTLDLYLDCLLLWLNLYVQFSGYSDVAIGFSSLSGIKVMENFNYPFLAQNISDFWKRWHISLTSWSRDYVFTPIASATRKPFIAVILAMLVIAFWHEISIRYIAWGVYHGCGIAVWHIYRKKVAPSIQIKSNFLTILGRIMATLITLNFVVGSTMFSRYLASIL